MEMKTLEIELSQMMAALKLNEPQAFDVLEPLKEAIETQLGFKWESLLARNNHSEISDARKVAIYLLSKYTLQGATHIGKLMNRDKGTITYSNSTARELLEYDRQFRNKVAAVENKLFAL